MSTIDWIVVALLVITLDVAAIVWRFDKITNRLDKLEKDCQESRHDCMDAKT